LSEIKVRAIKLSYATAGGRDRYYHLYVDMLDERRCHCLDMTIHETYLFLVIILQMGHDQRDRLKRLVVHTGIVLYGILRKHNETRQFLSHTKICMF
jgi:hypothetical protein